MFREDFFRPASGETLSTLNDLIQAAAQNEPNGHWYGYDKLFSLSGVPGLNFGKGFDSAFVALGGEEFSVHGSAISKMLKEVASSPEERTTQKESLLLEMLVALKNKDRMHRNDVISNYYSGEIDLDSLSPNAYFAIHFLLGMRGPNLDIVLTDQRGNPGETMEMVRKLLLFSHTRGYDGGERQISVVDYFGRFSFIHLEQSDLDNSGINILIQDPGYDDAWQKITNWRTLQHTTFRPGDSRESQIETQFDHTMLDEPIEMTGEPDSMGVWALHTARSIRTVITQSKNPQLGSSYIKKRNELLHPSQDRKFSMRSLLNKVLTGSTGETNKETVNYEESYTFETIMGIVGNLTVAFIENPEATIQCMQESGLDAVLPHFDLTLAQELSTILLDFRNGSTLFDNEEYTGQTLEEKLEKLSEKYDINSIQSFLKEAQNELFGGAIPHTEIDGPERNILQREQAVKIHSLAALAPFVEMFIPVSPDKITHYIPSERETITSQKTGARLANDDSKWPQVLTDLQEVFAVLQAEEVAGPNREDVLDTYRESMEKVRKNEE